MKNRNEKGAFQIEASPECAKNEVEKTNKDDDNSLATGKKILDAYIVKNKLEGAVLELKKPMKNRYAFDLFYEWSVSCP